jgi:hypothetical protein
MNEILEVLKDQMETNAERLARDEKELQETNQAIENGLDVAEAPSKIITRIEYYKGVHIGLCIAIANIKNAQVVA